MKSSLTKVCITSNYSVLLKAMLFKKFLKGSLSFMRSLKYFMSWRTLYKDSVDEALLNNTPAYFPWMLSSRTGGLFPGMLLISTSALVEKGLNNNGLKSNLLAKILLDNYCIFYYQIIKNQKILDIFFFFLILILIKKKKKKKKKEIYLNINIKS